MKLAEWYKRCLLLPLVVTLVGIALLYCKALHGFEGLILGLGLTMPSYIVFAALVWMRWHRKKYTALQMKREWNCLPLVFMFFVPIQFGFVMPTLMGASYAWQAVNPVKLFFMQIFWSSFIVIPAAFVVGYLFVFIMHILTKCVIRNGAVIDEIE